MGTERSYSVGVDLGGGSAKIALVGSDGELLAHTAFSLYGAESADHRRLLTRCRDVAGSAAAQHGLSFPPSLGCGVGVAALVDHVAGVVRYAGNIGWQNAPAREIGRELLGCDVYVDDDVAAGALADLYLGCAREARNLFYISWGTGIGAGLVIKRRLYHSADGAMNEFGHAPADPASSRLCYCGCRGCLEVEAGGKALVLAARVGLASGEESALRDWEDFEVADIADAAASGDAFSARLLKRAAVLMARSLSTVLTVVNPDVVVFGGGVSGCFPVIEDAFDKELRLRTPAFCLKETAIRQSSFGALAGAVGAAMLPRQRENEECKP